MKSRLKEQYKDQWKKELFFQEDKQDWQTLCQANQKEERRPKLIKL
jgi:hypothetical protein